MKWLVLLMVFFSAALWGQVLPRHVEFQELGLSFDVPDGWQGQLLDEAVVLGHERVPGMMILTENTSADAHSLQRLAMQGLAEDGLVLQPVGEFKIVGADRVEGRYRGHYEGVPVIGYAVGLINGLGSGMNILMITEERLFSQTHVQAAEALAASVRFYQSRQLPATAQWQQALTGMQLKFMSSGSNLHTDGAFSGSSVQRTIDLCADGRFALEFESTLQANTGGEAMLSVSDSSQHSGRGQWRMYTQGAQTTLLLSFDDGHEREYALAGLQSDQLRLAGERYFYYTSELCR